MSDAETFIKNYHKSVNWKIVFAFLCLILAMITLVLSIGFGKADISFYDSYTVFFQALFNTFEGDPIYYNVVWDVRVPRALMAVFVGAGLAVAGAVMQNLLMNPLAEPYTMGISSGAFLGAVLAITSGIFLIPFITGDTGTIVNAFILSLVPVLLIVLISKYKKTTATTMILCGIAIMYIFSSISTLLMVLADPTHLAEAYSWRVGNLGKVSWNSVQIAAPCITVLMILLILLAKRVNSLSIGDKGAISIGTDPYITRLTCFVIVALLTAFAVSFTGTIGFVGLVVPHIVRIFVGSNNHYLLPASAGFGGLFLVFMDTLAKMITETGLPVGVITSAIGGPLFIYILVQRRKKVWY